jgi:hypothetical protein
MNQFESATVYGNTRQVFDWDGNASPAGSQAGLSLDTTGLVPTNNYSVEMVFDLSDRAGAWRRILDVQNRASDAGFYLDPANHLDVYPVGAGSTPWTNDAFHHVVLTDANTGTVKGYLDGNPEFTLSTNVMDINNPGNLLNFFLDNNVGGGIGEYSDGQMALVRLYDTVLTDGQVRDLAGDPFGPAPVGTPADPEPCSLALLASGALPLSSLLRRRRNQA